MGKPGGETSPRLLRLSVDGLRAARPQSIPSAQSARQTAPAKQHTAQSPTMSFPIIERFPLPI